MLIPVKRSILSLEISFFKASRTETACSEKGYIYPSLSLVYNPIFLKKDISSEGPKFLITEK